eukprot:UN02006
MMQRNGKYQNFPILINFVVYFNFGI